MHQAGPLKTDHVFLPGVPGVDAPPWPDRRSPTAGDSRHGVHMGLPLVRRATSPVVLVLPVERFGDELRWLPPLASPAVPGRGGLAAYRAGWLWL